MQPLPMLVYPQRGESIARASYAVNANFDAPAGSRAVAVLS